MTITAGIDVGTGAIKVALFNVEGGAETCLVKRVERLRQRDPLKLAEQIYDDVLAEAGLKRGDVAYCATTGEGRGAAFSYRSLLLHDHPRPWRHLSAPRLPCRPRHRAPCTVAPFVSMSAARC